MEPRPHACTLAARESGKVNFCLGEPWTNNVGNSLNPVRSSVVLAKKVDKGVLCSSNLLVFNINNTQVNHLYSSVLLTIVSHTSHN